MDPWYIDLIFYNHATQSDHMFKRFSYLKWEHAYAWLIWFLSALFMCFKYALEVSPSVMTTDLMHSFSMNATQMGHLAACYLYSYLIMQIPAGLLVDRFGPKKVTSLSILVCALGAYLFSKAHSPSLAFLSRFIIGIGASFAALNCLKIISQWFPKKQFALMAGLMMTLGMLGAVVGQKPLALLIQTYGWREAMLKISVAGAILAVVFFVIVKNKKNEEDKDIHLTPKTRVLDKLKQTIQNPQTWYLSFYSGLSFAPILVFGGLWGTSFLSQKFNISSQEAAHNVSFIFIGFALGAPVFGWLSDKIGKRKPIMLWGTLVALASLIPVLYLDIPYVILALILFIFGFSISSFLLCFSMIAEISKPIMAATAIGFMNSFDSAIGAISDPLTGKFLDLTWQGLNINGFPVFSIASYQIALSTLPVYIFLALFFLKQIKETYCKETYPSSLP
ncbi:MAG: MFS transporter [Rhabdochlamydiaceae bacterium]